MTGINIMSRKEQDTCSISRQDSSVNSTVTRLWAAPPEYRCLIPGRGRKVFHMYKGHTGSTISLLSSGYCEISPWGRKLSVHLHLVPMLYTYVGKLRSVVTRHFSVQSDTTHSYTAVPVITAIQNRSLGSQQLRSPLLQTNEESNHRYFRYGKISSDSYLIALVS
jgi:hypothetical protein